MVSGNEKATPRINAGARLEALPMVKGGIRNSLRRRKLIEIRDRAECATDIDVERLFLMCDAEDSGKKRNKQYIIRDKAMRLMTERFGNDKRLERQVLAVQKRCSSAMLGEAESILGIKNCFGDVGFNDLDTAAAVVYDGVNICLGHEFDLDSLSADEEVFMIESLATREYLLAVMQPYIFHVASTFKGYASFMPTSDLMEFANIRLCEAITRNDPTKGSFLGFIKKRLNGAVMDAIRSNIFQIRVPVDVQAQFKGITDLIDDMTVQLERQPSINEVSESFGLPVEEVVTILQAGDLDRLTSIDDRADDQSPVVEMLSDPSAQLEFDKILERDLVRHLLGCAALSSTDIKVLGLRYRLDALYIQPDEVGAEAGSGFDYGSLMTSVTQNKRDGLGTFSDINRLYRHRRSWAQDSVVHTLERIKEQASSSWLMN